MRQQAKGNRVRIPDCPAAVSRSLSDDEHCATEKILEKRRTFREGVRHWAAKSEDLPCATLVLAYASWVRLREYAFIEKKQSILLGTTRTAMSRVCFHYAMPRSCL